MKVNTGIGFDALKGLIGRANTTERLWIADEWLRKNETITIAQFHELRECWDRMFRKYGEWKVVISCGSVHYDYVKGTYDEMLRVCKDSHWRHNYNNGCVWDMDLEEA